MILTSSKTGERLCVAICMDIHVFKCNCSNKMGTVNRSLVRRKFRNRYMKLITPSPMAVSVSRRLWLRIKLAVKPLGVPNFYIFKVKIPDI